MWWLMLLLGLVEVMVNAPIPSGACLALDFIIINKLVMFNAPLLVLLGGVLSCWSSSQKFIRVTRCDGGAAIVGGIPSGDV